MVICAQQENEIQEAVKGLKDNEVDAHYKVCDISKLKLSTTTRKGHEYSTVAVLPERRENLSRSWVIPVGMRCIHSDEDKELVGAEQFNTILSDYC